MQALLQKEHTFDSHSSKIFNSILTISTKKSPEGDFLFVVFIHLLHISYNCEL